MKCKKGGSVDSKYYDHMQWKAGCLNSGASTLEQVKQVLAAAHKNVKVIGKWEATDKWVTFLELLAAAKALHGNTKAKSELKQLLQQEKQ